MRSEVIKRILARTPAHIKELARVWGDLMVYSSNKQVMNYTTVGDILAANPCTKGRWLITRDYGTDPARRVFFIDILVKYGPQKAWWSIRCMDLESKDALRVLWMRTLELHQIEAVAAMNLGLRQMSEDYHYQMVESYAKLSGSYDEVWAGAGEAFVDFINSLED